MNNLSPLAFYPSRNLQPHRNVFSQHPTAIFCGTDIVPFCICNVVGEAPEVELYDKDDNLITSFEAERLITHDIVVDDKTVHTWLYQGDDSGILGYVPTDNGSYYLKIGSWYSGLFTIGTMPANYTQVEWQFYDDVLTADGNAISKHLLNRLVFAEEGNMVAKPEYAFDSEENVYNGLTYPVSQTSTKKYKFQVAGDEALADVLRLVRMADNIVVKSCINGIVDVLPTNTFLATPKWQGDDVCLIDCEFDAFNIAKHVPLTSEQPEPLDVDDGLYTEAQLDTMMAGGWVPVATAEELSYIASGSAHTMGAGTKWQDTYTCGIGTYYVLVRKINNVGNFATIEEIQGIIDGNNYHIRGANFQGYNDGGFLFGGFVYDNKGIIRNLKFRECESTHSGHCNIVCNTNYEGDIVNVHIIGGTCGNETAWSNSGGVICGTNVDGNIKYCSVDANCTATNAELFVNENHGVIEECYCKGILNNAEVTTLYNFGFVYLNATGASIVNCWSEMTIKSSSGQDAFAFCFENEGTITNCFDVSTIETDANGYAFGTNTGQINNSYYNTDLSTSQSATGKTTAQLKADSIGTGTWLPYSATIWEKKTNEYPTLKNNK